MSYSLKEFQSIKMYHCAYQGPCPRGFHIGSKAEWQSLIDALTTLGVYNVSDIPTVLNIPSAYYLARSNGSLETRYGIARYWTSTMTSNTIAWAWGIDQNPVIVFQEDKPGNAFSIRPFKDEPVIPDSSWTESPSGIFKNTTLGLISIQNGSNWITIKDKNLGATNVGDNGLYYQFGNNYGFTVNPTPYYTSKVSNTQAYGPSNYYDDEHFVRVSSGNNWFTDTNNNIRGGVDTTSLYPTEAKEVWLGNHKVRPSRWTPGANTIAYYPLTSTSTVNDMKGSGTAYNLTNNGDVTFGTYDGISCAKFGGTTNTSCLYYNSSLFTGSAEFTVNIWHKQLSTYSGWHNNILSVGTHNGTNGFIEWVNINSSHLYVGGWTNDRDTGYVMPVGVWQNIVYIHKNGTIKVYVNSVLKYTGTVSFNIQNGRTILGGGIPNTNVVSVDNMQGYLSNVIFESVEWTAKEISDYYNLTKGDYGL